MQLDRYRSCDFCEVKIERAGYGARIQVWQCPAHKSEEQK